MTLGDWADKMIMTILGTTIIGVILFMGSLIWLSVRPCTNPRYIRTEHIEQNEWTDFIYIGGIMIPQMHVTPAYDRRVFKCSEGHNKVQVIG